MKLTQITPPVNEIIKLVSETVGISDFAFLDVVSDNIAQSMVFELMGEERYGFLLLHSMKPPVSLEVDIYIYPQHQGKWANKGNIKTLRDLYTRIGFKDLGLRRLEATAYH